MTAMGRAYQLVFPGFLWVLLLIARVRSDTTGSCNLTVSERGTKLSQDTCMEEGANYICSEFVESFNRSLLPEDFQSDGLSVERPSALRLDPVLNNFKNQNLLPGMRIVWKSPMSESARANLKGFLLVYETSTGVGSGCRLFILNPEKHNYHMLEYSYELEYVARNAELSVSVYSWPPPRPIRKDEPSSFQRALAKTSDHQSLNLDPGSWVPSISLKSGSDGSLDVGMSLAPLQYQLTIFEIKLLKKSFNQANSFRVEFFNTTVASPEKQSDHFVFTNLNSDDYKVIVRPYDPFRKQEGKCLCWKKEASSANGKFCKNVCESIQSQWIHVDVNPGARGTPETTNEVETEPTAHSVGGMVNGSSLNKKVLVISLGAAVAALAFVSLIGYLCWRNRNSRKGHVLADIFRHQGHNSKLLTVEKPKGPLQPKTIYILSSEDHPAHVHLVDCLSQFLNLHCSCRVIYPPWNDLHVEGGLQWFLANINVCDFILFVDSEGAERLMEAHMKHMVYRQRPVGPEGDLFLMGVKHILAHQVVDHVVPVCFGVERCKKYLLSPVEYDLPKHLPQLLQKIHGLSSRDVEKFSSELPLCMNTVGELPCGAEMLSAIKAYQQYELQHPGWFAESFGEPKPIVKEGPFSCSSSGDSDYGSGLTAEDPMLSVSTQDLTFSDTAGSPISTFGRPGFMAPKIPTVARSVSSHWRDKPEHLSRPQYHSPQFRQQEPSLSPSKLNDIKDLSVFTLDTDVNVPTSAFRTNSTCLTTNGGDCTQDEAEPVLPSSRPIEEIVPPDSASSIISDNVSAALREINRRHETMDVHLPHRETLCEDNELQTPVISEHRDMNLDIIPPDSMSDVQIDSFSTALREINTRCSFAFGNLEDEMEMEGGGKFVGPDLDAVSV